MSHEIINNAQAAELLGIKTNTLDQKRRRQDDLIEGEHWFKDAGSGNAVMWTDTGLQFIAAQIDTDEARALLQQAEPEVTALSAQAEPSQIDGLPTEDIPHLDALAEELAEEALDAVRATYTADRAQQLISQKMRNLQPANPQQVKAMAGELLAVRLGRSGVQFQQRQQQPAAVEVEA